MSREDLSLPWQSSLVACTDNDNDDSGSNGDGDGNGNGNDEKASSSSGCCYVCLVSGYICLVLRTPQNNLCMP